MHALSNNDSYNKFSTDTTVAHHIVTELFTLYSFSLPDPQFPRVPHIHDILCYFVPGEIVFLPYNIGTKILSNRRVAA